MEVDWSVEVGPEASVIDPLWPGLVDLFAAPHRIAEVEEAARFLPLAQILLHIHQEITGRGSTRQESTGTHKPNTAASRRYAFWTAKCDLWEMEENEWDPDEMEAEAHQAQAAIACYIDLLPRAVSSVPNQIEQTDPAANRLLFQNWRDAEQTAKALALSMRGKPLRCSRADFIVRSAIGPVQAGFGITAYIAACGADSSTASATLTSALEILTETLAKFPWPDFTENPIPVQ